MNRFIWRNERGAVVILVAALLIVFLGFVAVAIDIGYVMVTRNESQNAADAAALAGARRLGENYLLKTSDKSTGVIAVALDTAKLNKVAKANLAETNIGIKIGTWDPEISPSFTETSTHPNAVWVDTKQENVQTYFARILGISQYDMTASACAAISGLSEEKPTIPLGIGTSYFLNDAANRGCTQIALNKTGSSCAGWTSLGLDDNAYKGAAAILKGEAVIPLIKAGSWAPFKGGTNTTILNALIELFDNKTFDAANKTFNEDGTVKDWTVSVVVYDDDGDCANPNKTYQIVGFSTVLINGFVETGSDKGPIGVVQCEIADDSRGGGFYAGTYGKIPGLVE